MTRFSLLALVALLMTTAFANGEGTEQYSQASQFKLSGVSLIQKQYKNQAALQVKMPFSSYQDETKEILLDRDFMAWIPLNFSNGTIDVDVASSLASDAPAYARGFIGVAFRIDDASRFESIYLRPTNSQADDQVRRNHSIQYAAYPDFRFDQLRKDFPEKYETYADIALGKWIHMRVVVDGSKATLYLDHESKPAFVVNDLKYGKQQRGGVGIWIESGTIAYFRELQVRRTSEMHQ
ncbi:hypothetical protein [Pseudomonas syringae]|uniref:hypothetical protein n=1 Tax=Pseudomonas syringae TaxID=317 RepID=UPI001F076128|nr:hypothetical protein [Pseudomonas syringae]